MPWFTWAGFVGSILFSLYWGRMAMANLSEEGQSRRFWVWFLGSAARRRYFTDRGWAYQQRAIWGGMGIWVVTLILTAILG